MSADIQPADARLRRLSLVVIGSAIVLAVIGLILFQRWISDFSSQLSSRELIAHLRWMIALALTGCALCLAALAFHCARLLRRVREQRRWPLSGSKVIRATPIRTGAATIPIIRWLAFAALMLTLLAVATALVSWRLYSVMT